MPRNDDIGDLPSLMPDSDEIKMTQKKSSSASKTGNTQGETPSSSTTRGGRDTARPIAASRMPPNAPQAAVKSNGLLWLLVVLMLLSVLGGGYWSYNKLTDVDLLLTVSRGELNHARKRIGELEALVVATDVNSNKSGTVVQTQVRVIDNRAKERNKFVDTEIDKLWGVAYRTNRPAIEENQKATDNNTATAKQNQENLKTQGERVSQQQSAIAQQQNQMEQAHQASDLALKNVQDQLHTVKLLQDKLAQLIKQSAEQEKNIAAQHKTDLGQAQLAQQQAQSAQQQAQVVEQQADVIQQQAEAIQKQTEVVEQQGLDLAALSKIVQGLSQQVATSDYDEDIVALSTRLDGFENKFRVVNAIEQNASEMDERIYFVEQSIDSVNSFRRDTNRSLDQLTNQVRNLAYSE